MTDDPSGSAHVPHRDLALVLRKATEIQEAHGAAHVPEGFTLEDVQHMASEIGIDPGLVRQVAEELPHPMPVPGSRLLGTPPRAVFEGQIPGVLTEAEMGELVAQARREMKEFGEVSNGIGGVTWTASSGIGEATVNLTAVNGQTTVQVLSNLDTDEGTLIGIFTPVTGVVLGLIVAGAASLGTPLALTATGVVACSTLGLVRRLWRSRADGFHRRMERLAKELSDAGARMLKRRAS